LHLSHEWQRLQLANCHSARIAGTGIQGKAVGRPVHDPESPSWFGSIGLGEVIEQVAAQVWWRIQTLLVHIGSGLHAVAVVVTRLHGGGDQQGSAGLRVK